MTKRIFTAVDISELARRKVVEYIDYLRKEFSNVRVSWEKPEKLHLTLKFLGEIDDEQIAKLIDAVEKTSKQISPFKLQIGGTGVFPSPRKARVLWLDLQDEKESLRKMNEILERECEIQGFAKEKRDFKSHLTIARFRQKPDESLIKKILRADFPTFEPFEVSEIVIYQSELLPRGSIYKVISKHQLKAEE